MNSSAIRRLTLLVGVFALCALGTGSSAAAESSGVYPQFDGSMSFPAIAGVTGPEEYSWEVRVEEDQELRSIDDQNAEVVYEDGHRALSITAQLAHDAEGKSVPTSIAIDGNVLTLTVHHKAGNPLQGGAPFVYPVNMGVGWEGGFTTVQIAGPPSPSPSGGRGAATAPTCVVPGLREWKLKAARHWLRQAQCSLGKVRGERRSGAKVVKQSRPPGTVLPAGARVAVKLG